MYPNFWIIFPSLPGLIYRSKLGRLTGKLQYILADSHTGQSIGAPDVVHLKTRSCGVSGTSKDDVLHKELSSSGLVQATVKEFFLKHFL